MYIKLKKVVRITTITFKNLTYVKSMQGDKYEHELFD